MEKPHWLHREVSSALEMSFIGIDIYSSFLLVHFHLCSKFLCADSLILLKSCSVESTMNDARKVNFNQVHYQGTQAYSNISLKTKSRKLPRSLRGNVLCQPKVPYYFGGRIHGLVVCVCCLDQSRPFTHFRILYCIPARDITVVCCSAWQCSQTHLIIK